MEISSVPCGPDPAVLLAPQGEVAAEAADPRVERAGAGAVGVVPIATVVVLVCGSLEHVAGPLEGGKLDAPVGELGAKLAKSSSCDAAARIGHAVPRVDGGTAAFAPAGVRALASSSWRSARSAATRIAWWSIV